MSGDLRIRSWRSCGIRGLPLVVLILRLRRSVGQLDSRGVNAETEPFEETRVPNEACCQRRYARRDRRTISAW